MFLKNLFVILKDGTSLAGAILEVMASAKMSGIFATHLHGILDLPLHESAQHNIVKKCMSTYTQNENSANRNIKWTYKLEDGICTDSLALMTAEKFGIPKEVLERAKILSDSYATTKTIKKELKLRFGKDPDNTEFIKCDTSTDLSIIDAKTLIEEICGCKAIHIEPKWTPPSSLEGNSCVYILAVGSHISDTSQKRHVSYYVGETDSFSQRLRYHRSKGEEWANIDVLTIPMKGKTEARKIESLLIRKMADVGFTMISTADGRNKYLSSDKII